MHGVETILFLVVLGTVVAAFAGRLRVPAPSLLVVAGLAVALLPSFPPVHVPPDVVSLVVLPPLLYAASEELPWRDLRAVWRPVTVLAVWLSEQRWRHPARANSAAGGRRPWLDAVSTNHTAELPRAATKRLFGPWCTHAPATAPACAGSSGSWPVPVAKDLLRGQ